MVILNKLVVVVVIITELNVYLSQYCSKVRSQSVAS